MRKAISGAFFDLRSHGSAVSTACSNSLVSANSCTTNREEEALKPHVATTREASGAQGGRGSMQSQWGLRHRSEGVANKGSEWPTPSYTRGFLSFAWGPLFLVWFYANRPPVPDHLKFFWNPSPGLRSHSSERAGSTLSSNVSMSNINPSDSMKEWFGLGSLKITAQLFLF